MHFNRKQSCLFFFFSRPCFPFQISPDTLVTFFFFFFSKPGLDFKI